MKNRVVFTIPEKDILVVIRKGKTTNKKISNDAPLVQTYTFSTAQWSLASTSKGFGMKKFFALDGANCLDCPYSGNMGEGGCYTHKFNQYVGFLSMLRSIKHEELTPLTRDKQQKIIELSFNSYVRFGTYGEPSLMPLSVIDAMVWNAKTWTGYTHQWEKEWAEGYKNYFMASTHDQLESKRAKSIGFRSFVSVIPDKKVTGVNCPASKEQGYKSNCEKCGLCSGIKGKGNKDVWILEH